MIPNEWKAPKDWPEQIREIFERGEFPILTEAELQKAKAFLKASGGRRRVSFEIQMENQRMGKQERDQSARRRLCQIALFNEDKCSGRKDESQASLRSDHETEARKPTVVASGASPGWRQFYKFVSHVGGGVLIGMLGNAVYAGTVAAVCSFVAGLMLAALVWAFVIPPRWKF
jgi:hypothetical protein